MWTTILPTTVLLAVCHIGGDRRVEAAGLTGSLVPLPPPPCILTASGQINATSLQILTSTNRLRGGISNALTCGNVPRDRYCSSVSGGIFCVLQYTDAGNCFSVGDRSPPTGNTDVVEVAATTTCPRQLIRRKYTKLGRKLCEEIVHQEDATLAKNRIKQLVQFYRNMPCLIQLARSQRFSWTVEDLLELTGAGGPRRVVRVIRALADAMKGGGTRYSSDDVMSMHDGALLSMSPEGLRAAVGPSASNNPNRRNIVRQFVSALNNDYEARSERRSGDRAAKRRADSSARRPSPTTVAVSDMLRPLNNGSRDDIRTVVGNPGFFNCFGDRELRNVPAAVACIAPDANITDAYANLTANQQRLMREVCAETLSGASMPDSLAASATAAEITDECAAYDTVEQLAEYVRKFSSRADTLTRAQVRALRSCVDHVLGPTYSALATPEYVTHLRVAIRHIPLQTITPVLTSQSAQDNYCEAVTIDGRFNYPHARDVLLFCLESSSLSVCDMGDLLRQLTVDEVDLLTPSSLVSCPAVLARHVTSRPARRRILDVYVDSRTGWHGMSEDDFESIGSLVTEMNGEDLAAIQSNETTASNLAAALPVTVAALADHLARVSAGDQPRSAVGDVQQARQLVVIAQLRTPSSSESERRRKRSVDDWQITCDELWSLSPHQSTVDLSNLNQSVFTECPDALNADNYNASQISVIADQARLSELGQSPCSWSSETIVQLGVIVVGLDPSSLSCMNFDNIGILYEIGRMSIRPPIFNDRYAAIYNKWRELTQTETLTADLINQLGHILCGAPLDSISSISLSDYDRSSSVIGGIDCFNNEALQQFASKAVQLYGGAANISVASIGNLGAVVAGMSLEFFQDLSDAHISAITPLAIAKLPPHIIESLTVDQINAMSTEQALAFNDEQLDALPPAVLEAIEAKISGISGETDDHDHVSTSSTNTGQSNVETFTGRPEDVTQEHWQPEGTENPNVEVVSLGNGDVVTVVLLPTVDSGRQDDNNTFTLLSDVWKLSTTPPYDDDDYDYDDDDDDETSNWPQQPDWSDDFDPFQHQTQIEDMVDAIPDNISSENVREFLAVLSLIPAADIASRLRPSALQNPDVLRRLQQQSMTPSQRQTVADLLEQTLPGTSDAEFSPALFASAGSLAPARVIRSLSSEQAVRVVSDSNFNDDDVDAVREYGEKIGSALRETTDRNALLQQVARTKQVLPGVPMSDFQAVLRKTAVDSEFLEAVSSAKMTEPQAVALYEKLQTDSPTDVARKTSSQAAAYVLGLPPALQTAVRADSLPPLDPLDAIRLLIQQTQSRDQRFYMDSVVRPPLASSPIECRLYEDILKDDLSTDNMERLIQIGQLQVDAVRRAGNRVCQADRRVLLRASDLALIRAIYDRCRPELGRLWHGAADMYGRLALAAAPGDINATDDDEAFMRYGVKSMCNHFGWSGTFTQLDVVVRKVKAHLDEHNDLKLQLSSISCILPFLGKKYLNTIQDDKTKKAVCKRIACGDCKLADSALVNEAIDFCIKAGVNVSDMYCRNGGQCLLRALTAKNIRDIPCQEIQRSLDVLAESVLDCSARAAIYKCVKTSVPVTESKNIAVYGTLVDQFPDYVWKTISNADLCGHLLSVTRVWRQWDYYAMRRAEEGLKSPAFCGNRPDVVSRLLAAENSVYCRSTTAKRRRRSGVLITGSGALTCDQVSQLGQSVSQLEVSQLQTLTAAEFTDCAYQLGRVVNFTEMQWKALASVAKKAHGSDVSQWTRQQLINAAGVVTGLSWTEIASLKLHDIESISAVGNNGKWSSTQLMTAFSQVKSGYKQNKVDALTTAELRSMGNLACGITATDIAVIDPAVFCGAMHDIGALLTCEAIQLQAKAKLVKSSKCLGPDVSSWQPSDIKTMGVIVGGLSKDDLGVLKEAHIAAIPQSAIPLIPPTQFNGFSQIQLSYFSVTQTAVITSSQYQSVDAAKQQVIRQKLSTVQDDLLNDPTKGGNAGSILRASYMTSMLAAAYLVLLLTC